MPRLYVHKRRTDFVLRRVQSNDPPGLIHRINGRGKDVIARADGTRYRNQRHRSKSFWTDFLCHESSPQRMSEDYGLKPEWRAQMVRRWVGPGPRAFGWRF